MAAKKQTDENNKLAQEALEEAKMSTKASLEMSVKPAQAATPEPLPAGL